jgi:hypothetical protein
MPIGAPAVPPHDPRVRPPIGQAFLEEKFPTTERLLNSETSALMECPWLMLVEFRES